MAKPISRADMTQSVDGKVTRQPKNDTSSGRAKFFWWKRTDDEEMDTLAQEIAGTIAFMDKHDTSHITQLVNSTRLYGNNSAYNLIGASFARNAAASSATSSSGRISFNLCSSIVDTLTAQVAKNKVVPTFITSGGTWGMQRKAELLNKFIEGVFYENKAHKKITYQARDAAVWGDGLVHVYRTDDDRVGIERVLPHEFKVDNVECAVKEKPSQKHWVKIADRGIMEDLYSDDEQALKWIRECPPSSNQIIGAEGTAADLITVAESWHLRSGKKATDGLHVITLPDMGKTLTRDAWDKDYYPFPRIQYSRRLVGYWGQGSCERTQNIQGELNRLMILDQKSRWMQASFKILVENSSKVVSQHLNNEVGTIIRYTGTPPQYVVPPAIDNSNAQKIDSLKRDGYEQEGVSQLSASNLKPIGVNSGAALRTVDQINQDRQLFFGQCVEEGALDIAMQAIDVAKDIFKEKGSYEVTYANTHFTETIDWADINLDGDEYWLKAFPTSSLPEEPAAKLETVTEYMQAGIISPRAGRRLLRKPDIEMADMLADAAEDLICKSIEEIIYDNKNVRPDAEWDLALAKDYGLKYLNFAKLHGCPAPNIKKLRKFMLYIDDEMGILNPPAPMPQPGAPPAGAPLANPMQPPTSQLLPTMPQAA